MPRRKSVHPQPLKRPGENEEEKEEEKTKKTPTKKAKPDEVKTEITPGRDRRTRAGSAKSLSPQTSPAPKTTGGKGSSKKITRINKNKGKEDESEKETSPEKQTNTDKVEEKEEMVTPKSTPKMSAKAKGKLKKSANVDDALADEKRNLSLEALFQVTHHELGRISKTNEDDEGEGEKDTEEDAGKGVESEEGSREDENNEGDVDKEEGSEVIQVTKDMVAVVPASSDSDNPPVLHIMLPEASTQNAQNVKIVSLESVPSEESEVGDKDTNFSIKLPISEKGIEKFQLKSESLEEQGLKLIYTKKAYDQYEPNPVSYAAYKPRSIKSPSQQSVEVASPGKPETSISSAAPTTGGRKRKHPAKPGKYTCQYCGRGCAKPSVLQKHIRAHTGERPYPCVPCGFSFKTKSNLYKHCKSRAHAIKAGLPHGSLDDSIKSSEGGKDDSLDIDEMEWESGNEEDADLSMSERSDSQVRELRSEGSSVTSMQVEDGELSDAQAILQNVSMAGCSANVLIRQQSSGSTKLIMTERQYYDVKYVDKGAAEIIVTKSADEEGESSVEAVEVSSPSALSPQLESSLRHKLTSKKGRADTIATMTAPSANKSMPITKRLLAETSRSMSLPAPVKMMPPIDPKMTPDMLRDRITRLISANAAIIDMPMADAPRPKRMSRQNSAVSVVTNETAAAVQGLQVATGVNTSPGVGAAISETDPSTPDVAASQVKHILAKTPTTIGVMPVPSDTTSASVDTVPENIQKIFKMVAGGASGASTPSSVPQEIKIQIKLAKPGSSQPGLASSSQPAPGTPQPMIGQPGVQFPTPPSGDGNIIKDLLLKNKSGHHSSLMMKSDIQVPPAIQTVDVATTEKLDPGMATSVGQQVIVMEGKDTPVAYIEQTSQDVPMHVAEDVEVASTDLPKVPRRFSRSLSVPSGPTTPLTPTTPPLTFEAYDPHKPPKRGRPKGSKNRPTLSFDPQTPTTPIQSLPHLLPSNMFGMIPQSPEVMTNVLQMPLLQSAPMAAASIAGQRPALRLMIPQQTSPIPTPHRLGTPGLTLQHAHSLDTSLLNVPTTTSAPLTRSASLNTAFPPKPDTPTTQSLWKLKLKGKLLMKRSMSVERMLSQEREKLERSGSLGTPSIGASGSLLSPPKLTDIFRRSESVDEGALRQQQRARQGSFGENSVIAKMLASKSPHKPLVPSPLARLERQKAVSEESPPPKLRLEKPDGEIEDVILVSTDDESESGSKRQREAKSSSQRGIKVPANEGIHVFSRNSFNMAPIVHLKNTNPKMQIIPNLIKGGNQFMMRRAESVASESEGKKTKDSHMKKQDSVAEAIERAKKGKGLDKTDSLDIIEKADDEKEKEDGEEDKTESDNQDRMQSLEGGERDEEPMEGVVETGGEILEEVQEENEKKLNAQLQLLGHQYPVLNNKSHGTFCTVAKPQPMYVPQGSSRRISMYSNWRVATYNPNPMGLTSKELMALHQSRWYDVEPLYQSASGSDSKLGILTHSSYWNFYNQMKAKRDDLVARVEPEVAVKQVSEVLKLSEEMNKSFEESEVPVPQAIEVVQVVETTPVVANETVLKETISVPVSTEPNRVPLFAGGFKSNEEYIYVRGRGRGKYVCEECGIRCKKPSMLKKHIRTHTDLRPYHCKFCSFSFKTKGNLTKHMKSKAHHKKCFELGIVPVPISIDESQIDTEALARQQELSRGSKIMGLDDTESSFDDGAEDEEDEEEGDEEEEEEIGEVVIDDGTVYRIEPEKGDEFVEGPRYIAIQQGDSSEPTLVCIEADGTQQEDITVEVDTVSLQKGEQVIYISPDGTQQAKPSLDKEIAAHTLLDLSKVSSGETSAASGKSREKGSERPKLRRQRSVPTTDDEGGSRLGSLIGELKTRTQKGSEDGEEEGEAAPVTLDKAGHISVSSSRMSATLYQPVTSAMSEQDTSEEASSVAQMTGVQAGILLPEPRPASPNPPPRRGINTYAQKIAALQSANENDLKMTLERNLISVTGSGFVPPVFSGDQQVALEYPPTNRSSTPKREEKSSPPSIAEVTGVLPVSATLTFPSHQIATAGVSSTELERSERMSEIRLTDSPTSDITVMTVQDQNNFETISIVRNRESPEKALNLSNKRDANTDVPLMEESPGKGEKDSETLQMPIPFPANVIQLHGLPPVAPSSMPVGVRIMTTVTSPTNTVSSVSLAQHNTSSQVQFVTSENRAPFEIVPMPGNVSDPTESMVDGKYVCNICQKSFPKYPQLTIHKNIHYIERPFRCEDCGISFRTKGHLQKHQRSENHVAKMTMNQQFGVPSTDNPRPYKCDDCKVAFRIHGHLAKHVRSKLHITTLEKLGKVPAGTYEQIEKGSLDELDVGDDGALDDSGEVICEAGSSKEASAETAAVPLDLAPQPVRSSTPRKEGATSTSASPVQESFQFLGGYERNVKASNEKVTVEMKSDVFDISEFSQQHSYQEKYDVNVDKSKSHGKGSKRPPLVKSCSGQEVAAEGEENKAGNKCGICGNKFQSIEALKQHLVCHAELRPYVCEYCDAGFTTGQSLKFHLETHRQERPYVCGQCGDTFARSDRLRVHINSECGGSLNKPTSQAANQHQEKQVISMVTRSGSVDPGQQVVMSSLPLPAVGGGMPLTVQNALSNTHTIPAQLMPTMANSPLQIVALRGLTPVIAQSTAPSVQQVASSVPHFSRQQSVPLMPVMQQTVTQVVDSGNSESSRKVNLKSQVAQMGKSESAMDHMQVLEINSDTLKGLNLENMTSEDGQPVQIYIIEEGGQSHLQVVRDASRAEVSHVSEDIPASEVTLGGDTMTLTAPTHQTSTAKRDIEEKEIPPAKRRIIESREGLPTPQTAIDET